MDTGEYKLNLHVGHLFNYNDSTPRPEVLKELTDSRYNVYDVLSTFFNHEDPYIVLGEFCVLCLCSYQ